MEKIEKKKAITEGMDMPMKVNKEGIAFPKRKHLFDSIDD